MEYKVVIFDFDGTVADTSPGILNCIRYTQKKMNLPEIPIEQMYSHVGPPMEESYNRNFGLTGESLRQAVAYHKEYAINYGYKELELYDGMIQLLDKLKQQGIKTAVATLKANTTVLKILEDKNLLNKFDVVLGTDSATPLTKAQLIEKCINQINCEKQECVLVGDSNYDAAGAMQAGIDFVAVTYGFGFKTEEELSEYKHVKVCKTVSELDFLL